jgi:hypothetical protein
MPSAAPVRQGIEVRLEHDACEEGAGGEALARVAASLEATFLNSAANFVGCAPHDLCMHRDVCEPPDAVSGPTGALWSAR